MARVWRNRFVVTVAILLGGSVALTGGVSLSHPGHMPALRFTDGEAFSGQPDGYVLVHVASARNHIRVPPGEKPTVERAAAPHAGPHIGSPAPARPGMNGAGVGIYHGGPRNEMVRENAHRTAAHNDEVKAEVARQIAEAHAGKAQARADEAQADS